MILNRSNVLLVHYSYMQSKSFEKKVNKGKPAVTSDTTHFAIFPFTIPSVCITSGGRAGTVIHAPWP